MIIINNSFIYGSGTSNELYIIIFIIFKINLINSEQLINKLIRKRMLT